MLLPACSTMLCSTHCRRCYWHLEAVPVIGPAPWPPCFTPAQAAHHSCLGCLMPPGSCSWV